MMKRHSGIRATVVVFCILLGSLWIAAPACAEELYRESAEVNSMMTKLGRGAANVATCLLEVPKQIAHSIRQTDPVTGVFVGFVRGVGWGYTRLAVGVYEVFTFPFPAPKNYEPLLEPEYIVKAMWGEPIPIVSDPHNNWPETGEAHYQGDDVPSGEPAAESR